MEFIGIAVLIALVILGIPIYLSILIGACVIVVLVMDLNPITVTGVMFNSVSSYILVSVPLFVLSGQLIGRGGCLKPLANLLNAFMGHLPGGPAYAIVIACVVFAAMASSSMAAIAGFAPVAIPLLTRLGYSKKFAIGLVLVSGSMAPIIPPSVSLILYGFVTQTSVITLWTAALIPGLVQAALIMFTIWIHSRRGHYQRLPSMSWAERWKALKEGWPILLMPAAVLGPLYGGIATPSEAASIAVGYSLVLGLFIYRGLNLKELWRACLFTVEMFAAVFALVMGAFLLNMVLVYLRVPFNLSDGLANLGMNWAGFMGLMFVTYFLMGAFLDPSSILLISVPILMPTIVAMGVSPIVYGVFTVNCLEIAGLTPPYGLLLFAAAIILKEDFFFIVRSMIMFYPAVIIHPILIAYIPQMSLWLPHLLGR
ncbi:TRAP transporter large permease [Chloroflexota bacterium]